MHSISVPAKPLLKFSAAGGLADAKEFTGSGWLLSFGLDDKISGWSNTLKFSVFGSHPLRSTAFLFVSSRSKLTAHADFTNLMTSVLLIS
jgi:hypothetical protein